MLHERGIDILLITSRHNVRYMTGGYYMPFYARHSRAGSDRYLSAVAIPAQNIDTAFYVSRDNELDYMKAFGGLWIREVQTSNRRSAMTLGVAEQLAENLRARGLAGGTIGVELPFIPANALAALRHDLPDATFRDATELLGHLRAVKTAAELEALRSVHRDTADAIHAVLQEGRADVTTRQVAAHIQTQIEGRGTGAEYMYALTNLGPGLVRAPSDERWGRGRPLQVDAGAELQDYMSDVARMGSVGPVPARARDMYDTCLAVQDRIRGVIVPGLSCAELWRIGSEAMTSTAWGRWALRAHGLGIVSHEPPEITSESTHELEAGMVVSLETEYLDPDVAHVKLEDTVAVTPTGCEGLGDVNREWCVASG